MSDEYFRAMVTPMEPNTSNRGKSFPTGKHISWTFLGKSNNISLKALVADNIGETISINVIYFEISKRGIR
jgi:hypothetical protein